MAAFTSAAAVAAFTSAAAAWVALAVEGCLISRAAEPRISAAIP